MKKQVLTIVCKINPAPEQVAKIEATFQAFADACNGYRVGRDVFSRG